MSVEAGYVGTKGTHVFAGTGGDYDPNQADINGFGTLTTNQRKPFFQKFGWTQNLRYYGIDASNNYHSLQLKFDKRFSSASTSCRTTPSRRTSTMTAPTIRATPSWPAASPATTARHVFFLASLYEFPFGKGRKYLTQRLEACGSHPWRLAVERHLLLDGRAAVHAQLSRLQRGPRYRLVPARSDRRLSVSTIQASSAGSPQPACRLTANGQVDGPWQRPQRGKFGTVGRNEIVGPSFAQMDMSFFKTFNITEGHLLQFRAESFNFPNHTNLANPNACVDCPGVAGRIFGAFANYVPRQWQFALKYQF